MRSGTASPRVFNPGLAHRAVIKRIRLPLTPCCCRSCSSRNTAVPSVMWSIKITNPALVSMLSGTPLRQRDASGSTCRPPCHNSKPPGMTGRARSGALDSTTSPSVSPWAVGMDSRRCGNQSRSASYVSQRPSSCIAVAYNAGGVSRCRSIVSQ